MIINNLIFEQTDYVPKVIEIIIKRKAICSIIIGAFVNVKGGPVMAYNVNDFQNMYDCLWSLHEVGYSF